MKASPKLKPVFHLPNLVATCIFGLNAPKISFDNSFFLSFNVVTMPDKQKQNNCV